MTQKVKMNLMNLRENYNKEFLKFVQRVARECNAEDSQCWIYQDYQDGEPCLWAGRYDRGKIEVEEYVGVNEETNDFGNNIPTTVIYIDCCQDCEEDFAELIAALTE